MTCVDYGDGLIVTFAGPQRVYAERAVGERWCFVCRKRVDFTDRLTGDAEPSYYEPVWTRECPRGHSDGDLFPGYERTWGDD